jgi:hypothetical protein
VTSSQRPADALPAPQDRLVTLPEGLPALTLGDEAVTWAEEWLTHPNGPRAGQPWRFTGSQIQFLLWFYAITPEGRWLFEHGVRRLPKGSGKSPAAGVLALIELLGPVRMDCLDHDLQAGVRGKPVDMPLVQIAACSESQTANTMRMVRALTAKASKVVREYKLDTGKTVIYTPDGGQLEVITSSATAAEGALVTFCVEDETEHWKPANGGFELAATIDRNLAKSNSRAVETCNAWEPGAGSVAEATWDAWAAQEEGRTRSNSKILYDARVAPPDTDLADDESLVAGIAAAYGDCFWIDKQTIKDRILSLRTSPDIARRFYLNQPVASLASWVTQQEWAVCSDPSVIVADADEIVAFFDGSRTNDATALVGCHVETGHVFCIDVWEPVQAHVGQEAEPVPVDEVDAAVEQMFDRWSVKAFFADVREWESFAKVEWPKRYADSLAIHAVPGGKDPQAIAWDMRTHVYDFTMACELTLQEIQERGFTHDGDSRVGRHMVNARRHPNRWGVSIAKETRDSPKKIDAAVCVIGARMARRLYLAAEVKQEKPRTGRVWGFA